MFPFKTGIGRYQWRKRFSIRLPLDSPSARLGKFRHVCQPFLIACDLHFLNYPTPDDLSSPILFTSTFSNEKHEFTSFESNCTKKPNQISCGSALLLCIPGAQNSTSWELGCHRMLKYLTAVCVLLEVLSAITITMVQGSSSIVEMYQYLLLMSLYIASQIIN